MIWLEAMLPLGIIAGMLCVMGNAQYYIHKAAHGRVFSPFFFFLGFRSDPCFHIDFFSKLMFNLISVQPKHIGNDMWDEAMEKRDKKLIEKLSPSS